MGVINVSCSMKPRANILFRCITKFKKYFPRNNKNYKSIPVIINNYNRLDCLLKLLDWLERAGMKNIFIIDNASDYPPLLNFYNNTSYTIFRLDSNKGHFSLWETIIFSRFSDNYYIYTDPDIIPVEECPLDAVKYFEDILKLHKEIDKIGFGLKIDDLPDYYPLKQKVLEWEKQFWRKQVKPNLYDAMIDTTFALYRPNVAGGVTVKAFRTGGKYMARHIIGFCTRYNYCICCNEIQRRL